MNSEIFTNSGAVITMPDQQSYLATDCQATSLGFDTQKTESLTANDDSTNYFLVPEYSLQKLNQKVVFKHFVSLNQVLETVNESFKTEPDLVWTCTLESYKEKYAEAMKCIRSGELKKVVPFMAYETPKPRNFSKVLLPQILKRLSLIKTENEFFYGCWSEDQGFIGLTPEILLQKKQSSNVYQTMALAGTLPAQSEISMRLDSKLKEEHAFVMKDISNKLRDHKLSWSEPVEKVYGILKHLYATAAFESDLTIQDLISKLSPTSALGLYPSHHWQEYKTLLGIGTRGSYGAPFGWIHNDEINIVVCLRGLFWDQEGLRIYVGGGVTSQSDFDTELKELELKFLSTKNKLGL